MAWQEDPEKVSAQRALLAKWEFLFLRNGPPWGETLGWPSLAGLFYRCSRCGYYMKASDNCYDTCYCGAMHRDVDAGRFGSTFGDDAIESVRGDLRL
jgi:hypothetical protein